ncbi:FlgD-like protein [Roseivirga ehrenbergii]|uniref:Gingipain domain-containing protein n=1 Tax=Roseivirga ehrenbergii (strain DSM 102268 / JCM 13514 / KCTC 12282 / NCIMB 14502 / KMM 6017) TaxID=279360 RepID=A0A150XTD8_ROSEK|nr:C25 family cysteine peptidase [Roseivirga ehrenbergii]KYG82001.1 hypothetical protein MB14_00995 [Roseivirga ehrenbergii]TCL01820.1 FlgD-like protein [Roseivirga ehrenbergii]
MRRVSKIGFLAIASLMIISQVAHAQLIGNEWIDYSRSYFKIKTGSDDIHRLTYESLLASGYDFSEAGANNFKLFHRGKEVAISVNDGGDGAFGAGDYIEFFGKKNDGTQDTELFNFPTDQIHKFYNLFSDTTAFFLTNSEGAAGKRMEVLNESTAGLTPVQSHTNEILQVYTSQFSFGQYYQIGNPSGEVKLSRYDRGQMFVSDTIMRNEFTLRSGKTYRDFVINNATLGVQTEGTPRLTVQIVGFNNRLHNTSIHVGPDTENLRTISQDIHLNYSNFGTDTKQIEWSDISSTGRLIVRVEAVGFPEIPDDRVAVGYIKLSFPQEVDAQARDKLIFNLPTKAGNSLVEIENVVGESDLYDITDYRNIRKSTTTLTGSTLSGVVKSNNEIRKVFMKRRSAFVTPSIEKVTFNYEDVTDNNYLIISHPELRKPVAGRYDDPVQAYIDYRSSIEGGNFNVLYADVTKLYDEFSYGEYTPLAIRRFVRHVYNNSDPEYLFIIGRGRRVDNQVQRLPNPLAVSRRDLVPTMGAPGSDILYTQALNGVANIPTIPVGRLSVNVSTSVANYLDKVKEKEASLKDSPWTKNFVHLSGGLTSDELVRFKGFIEGFGDQVSADYLGANVNNVSKNTNNAVQKFNISEEVNKGVGLITFFGHSSSSFTDIDIGTVSNPSNGYNNQGRYTAFIVNGCRGGEIFDRTSFGEDWLSAEGKGAVNFIAHSDVGIPNSLRDYTAEFYKLLADTLWMTQSIGNIQKETIKNYLANNFQIDQTDIAAVEQILLQGDPAIPLFGHDKVDYTVRTEDVFLRSKDGREITAASPFFELGVIVNNGGRTSTDSLSVTVNRKLDDGTVVNLPSVKVKPVRYQDTVFYEIANQGLDFFGENRFEVILDAEGSVNEGSELNNSAEASFFFPAKGTFNTAPFNFQTINTTSVDLVVQSADLKLNDRSFVVQIDTVNTFDSPWKKEQVLTGKGIATWSLDLVPATVNDTIQYYWRSVFQDELIVDPIPWENSYFTYIENSVRGWAQTEFDQLTNLRLSSVAKSEDNESWVFAGTTTSIEIETYGSEHASGQRASDVVVNVNGQAIIPANPCNLSTFNAIAFNKDSGQPYFVLQTDGVFDENDPLKCGRSPSYINSFTNESLSDVNIAPAQSLMRQYVDGVDDGDFVLFFSVGQLNYDDWRTDVRDDMERVGASRFTINALQTGEPYIMYGRKGQVAGQAQEVVGEPIGADDNARKARITFDAAIIASIDSGSVQSPTIGPASAWGRFTKDIELGATDQITFDIVGVAPNGTETVLFPNIAFDDADLSGVDPVQYPYLRFYVVMKDKSLATPPQLKNWSVSFAGVPEGVVSLQNDKNTNIELDEGEPFNAQFRFTNISEYSFQGPLEVRYILYNQNTREEITATIEIPAVAAGEFVDFTIPVDTKGKVGLNDMEVFVNNGGELEQYFNNNVIRLEGFYNVLRDETNPAIDVTFDGVNILDGDIVSPRPLVALELRDNNPYLLKTDTLGVEIKLGAACDGCQLQRINFSDPNVTFTPATENSNYRVQFQPDGLEDGVYSLQVEATDASGNQSGIGPYTITFEVINEATVTNFYPYPNPFSSSTRFVFTLTGTEVPDQVTIQIFTVSGKVVREITQDELGPIRIGNNITDYAWDGKDEFGDQLANGTYLYRVKLKANGQDLGARATKGDRGFNKLGFGKLVILR